ncbi:MAG TPA: hypothetical protein VL284_12960 [Thermoanaerobaculia bacterium]|nr:hypothetical protein [Thermoanaerobaculia bacterium]
MNRKVALMLILTCIAIVLWALGSYAGVGFSADATDFFGGLAIGLGIGTIVSWFAKWM